MSIVALLRDQHGEAFQKKYNVKLGLMSFFIKAAIDALKQFPVVNAEVRGKPGVAILLTYGPDRDWLKNLNAAGGGRMRRHGKTFRVTDPQTVSKEQAATHVGGAAHRVFARLPFEQAVLLTKAE